MYQRPNISISFEQTSVDAMKPVGRNAELRPSRDWWDDVHADLLSLSSMLACTGQLDDWARAG